MDYSENPTLTELKETTERNLIVELRNGERKLITENSLMGYDNWIDYFCYNEDLTYRGYNPLKEKLDIVKIYKTSAQCLNDLTLTHALNLLWKRN